MENKTYRDQVAAGLSKLQNISFRWKLILTYFCAALIPMLIWMGFSYKQTRNALEQQAQSSLQIVCDTAAANMYADMQGIEYALDIFVNNQNLSALFSEKSYEIYKVYIRLKNYYDIFTQNMINLNPKIEEFYIYSNSDISGVRAQFLKMKTLESEHPALYDKIMGSQKSVWFHEDGNLQVYQRILDMNTYTCIGIACVQLDYDAFFESILSDSQQTSPAEVWAADGQCVFRNGAAQQKDAKHLVRTESTIGHPDWSVKLYSELNLSAQLQSALMSTLGVMLLSFGVLLFLIWYFSSTLARRVLTLKNQVASIADQRFSFDLYSDAKDEIGDLTNSIGAMVKESRKMIYDVYESKMQQRDAEIKALQAQINPHFLYNTLSLIKWNAIQQSGKDISSIVDALSAFYRRSLNSGKTVISIEEEIKMAQAYVEIQLYLHNHTIDVKWNIDEEIYDYDMPSVILQPIIENAIEHGTDCLETKKGVVAISGYCLGHDIVFEVLDNGPGMSAATIETVLTDKTKGYGVRNVNDRIRLFFSNDYGVSFVCPKEGGTRARITIPKYIDCEQI